MLVFNEEAIKLQAFMKEVRMVRKKQDHPVSDPPKDPGMGSPLGSLGEDTAGGVEKLTARKPSKPLSL